MVSDLPALVALGMEKLDKLDIGLVNLLCAQQLPGDEGLDVRRALARLDEMAARARSETYRHYYRFQRNPAEFENSEGFFRMLMLAVVLAEDFHVQYTPSKISNATDARIGDGFFGDAHDVFLHGLTGPKRQGTCSSLPVLQVAIGRRLGYPLKLVTTKGHLFVRWEDAPSNTPLPSFRHPLPVRRGEGESEGRVRERFNIEAAGKGVNRFPDDYYRHWPLEVSEAEVQAEGYLKSLSPAAELAVFLSIRGMCLSEAKRYADAAVCFREAARLAACQGYRVMQAEMERMAASGANKTIAVSNRGETKP